MVGPESKKGLKKFKILGIRRVHKLQGFILQMGNSQENRCCLQNFHRLDKICKNHLEHAGKLKIIEFLKIRFFV